MFKIIKKGSGNFWHNFNNGSKEVNLSDWEIVLDSVNQTVSLQMLNGANVPINSVFISDILIIDETDGSVEETFVSVEALRIRLVELNYTPYIVLNGFVPEAPIDGLTYGRKDAEWVEVSGGGSVGTLQQVTDNGNTTTNDIKVSKLYLKDSASELNGRLYLDSNNWFFEDSDGVVRFIATEGSIFLKNRTSEKEAVINTNLLTANRTYTLPDTSGTIALNSEIPTVDATPTDGSSNAVSSNGVFDGLANKQNTLTETNFGSFINSLTAKNTLVDADEVVSDDSADSNKAKKTTWLNVWNNYLKPKADALYQAILTDVNFGSFSNGLTGKTTPVDADSVNIVDSADSNKAKKVSLTNFKAFLKTYFDSLYSVPCITITTSSSIDTDSTGSGYGQHGRNTKIANSTNAINLTVQTTSNADFVASYTKIGSATITFVAGSGATLVQLSGTAAMTGSVGSTATLTRHGNTYYLQITNY